MASRTRALTLVIAATLCCPPQHLSGGAFDPPFASAEDSLSSPGLKIPVYKPRKENAPRARIGGHSRGSDVDAPELIALVPDHVAFTIRSGPSLCWYLSIHSSKPITVTVVDSRGIRPILEQSLPSPARAGIHCLRLREYGVDLREQEQYRWFVTLVLNPDRPSQDIVAGGVIERIPLDEACALDMPCTWTTCELEAVYRYADSGLWYDALACLLELMEREKDPGRLQRLLDGLLKQSGIDLPS
jgi:hypothetical protein